MMSSYIGTRYYFGFVFIFPAQDSLKKVGFHMLHNGSIISFLIIAGVLYIYSLAPLRTSVGNAICQPYEKAGP